MIVLPSLVLAWLLSFRAAVPCFAVSLFLVLVAPFLFFQAPPVVVATAEDMWGSLSQEHPAERQQQKTCVYMYVSCKVNVGLKFN